MPEESATWYLATMEDIRRSEGYVAPMSGVERQNWKRDGCPFRSCFSETDGGTACAAPNCGV